MSVEEDVDLTDAVEARYIGHHVEVPRSHEMAASILDALNYFGSYDRLAHCLGVSTHALKGWRSSSGLLPENLSLRLYYYTSGRVPVRRLPRQMRESDDPGARWVLYYDPEEPDLEPEPIQPELCAHEKIKGFEWLCFSDRRLPCDYEYVVELSDEEKKRRGKRWVKTYWFVRKLMQRHGVTEHGPIP